MNEPISIKPIQPQSPRWPHVLEVFAYLFMVHNLNEQTYLTIQPVRADRKTSYGQLAMKSELRAPGKIRKVVGKALILSRSRLKANAVVKIMAEQSVIDLMKPRD
jgi:uncharacterized protein YdbL (DUF1318 family)